MILDSFGRSLASMLNAFRERRRRQFIERLCDRGMRLGENVVIMQGVIFDADYPWLIEIEAGCRLSANTRIMAHDATPFRDFGVTRIGRVRILKDSFIGENTIILPGVSIGPRAMVAAGSVVGRDIGEGVLAAGNPARVYGQYDEYLARTKAAVQSALVVPISSVGGDARIAEVRTALDLGHQVFVRDAEAAPSYFHNITDAEVKRRATEAYERNFGDTH